MGGTGDKPKPKDKQADAARRKKQAEQAREIAEARKAKEAQRKKQAEQQSQGKSADTQGGKAGDRAKPADKKPESKGRQEQAEQTRKVTEARKEREAQQKKRAERTGSAARPPEVSVQQSHKDDVFRPGISDQLPQSKPSDAGGGSISGGHPRVGPGSDVSRSVADGAESLGRREKQSVAGDPYRPGISDKPPQSKFQGTGGSSGERADAKAKDQKSYADQDTVYRPGISDRQPQSKPGEKREGKPGEDRPDTTKVERPRTPEEERKERERVDHPADGVGFKFGSARLGPESLEHLERFYQQNREALSDPDATVRLLGHASRPGDDFFNWGLSMDRANAVCDWMEKRGVRANIFPDGEGEDAAGRKGRLDNVDYADDRVVKIKIERADKPAEKKTEKPKADKPRIDVPEEYQKGYKHDRGYAEKKAQRTLWDTVKDGGVPKPNSPRWIAKQIVKGFREMVNASDYVRWCKETPWERPPDEKLWEVTPPKGISGDLQNNPGFRRQVEGILRQGSYDPKKMYKEYLVHWIRKGAT